MLHLLELGADWRQLTGFTDPRHLVNTLVMLGLQQGTPALAALPRAAARLGLEPPAWDVAQVAGRSTGSRPLLAAAALDVAWPSDATAEAALRHLHAAGAPCSLSALLCTVDQLDASAVQALLACERPQVDAAADPSLTVAGFESYTCPIHRTLHALHSVRPLPLPTAAAISLLRPG